MANVDVVVPIPKPKTKPSPTVSKGGFPPALPTPKLPKIPDSAVKTANKTKALVSQMQKVVGTMQSKVAGAVASTITFKVKQGGSVIFEQKVAPLSEII